jgi:hypothetical protein
VAELLLECVSQLGTKTQVYTLLAGGLAQLRAVVGVRGWPFIQKDLNWLQEAESIPYLGLLCVCCVCWLTSSRVAGRCLLLLARMLRFLV